MTHRFKDREAALGTDLRECIRLTNELMREAPLATAARSGQRDLLVDVSHVYLESLSDCFVAAADRLFERTSQNDDRFAFPVMYLYRHAVELKLKALLEYMDGILGNPTPRLTHDLVALFDATLNDLDNLRLRRFQREHDVARLIRALSALDPRSTGFRYPDAVNTDAIDGSQIDRTNSQDQGFLNLSMYKDAVRILLDELEGWMTGVYETMQNRYESSRQ